MEMLVVGSIAVVIALWAVSALVAWVSDLLRPIVGATLQDVPVWLAFVGVSFLPALLLRAWTRKKLQARIRTLR